MRRFKTGKFPAWTTNRLREISIFFVYVRKLSLSGPVEKGKTGPHKRWITVQNALLVQL